MQTEQRDIQMQTEQMHTVQMQTDADRCRQMQTEQRDIQMQNHTDADSLRVAHIGHTNADKAEGQTACASAPYFSKSRSFLVSLLAIFSLLLSVIVDRAMRHASGVLALAGEDSAVHRFICCDQQMLNGTATELAGNSVETTTDLVGRTALSVLGSSGLSDAPTKPRLTEIAAFASTSIADTVLIEHAGSAGGGGAGENLAVLQREDSESRYEFASRVRETLSGLEPTAAPCYPFRASLRDAAVSPERLVVFGGELEQKDATRLLTAVALPQHKTRPQPTVVLVNLRSNQEQVERRTVGRSNPYWAVLVGGADVAPAVQSALKEVADEVEAKAKAAEQEKAKKAAQQDGDAASSSRTCTTSSKPAKLQPVSEPTGAAAAAEEETEATKQERQKWAKRMKYTLGMVFVAEFDAVPVQVSKQLDSPAVRIGGGNDGPVLLLDKDELMQAVGMDITSSGPAGSKSVPRVKIDCRSLKALAMAPT